MRIGVLCPVWFPVPPEAYGGTERVVALLADGLVDAGHDVTLFASGDSQSRARVDAVFQSAPSEWIGHTFWEMQHAIHALRRSRDFDVLHDHTGLLGLALGGLLNVPFCHTVHGPLTGQPGRLYEDVLSISRRAKLISISMNQRKPKPHFPWIANCFNALDLSVYPFRRRPGGDYLVFLGRMSPEKGAHRALAVALETGLPLKIAAKCREPLEIRYFDEFIRPHLGGSIEYVGEVGHADKVELLMGARALISPIDWEEPFGLMMIEAMACGTPVLSTRRGSAPEIIDHGRTGVLVENYREMEDAAVLELADSLDPAVIRREVEERFSPERMVADYVAAYEATIEATWTAASTATAAVAAAAPAPAAASPATT